MAANLDKAESALTTVSDVAFVRAVDASGNSVKISKSDLASVLGAVEYNNNYQTKEEFYAACADKFIWAGTVFNVGYFASINITQGNYLMFYYLSSSIFVKFGALDESAAPWRQITLV